MTPKQIKEQEVEDALQRERDERAKRGPRDTRPRVRLGLTPEHERAALRVCRGH